MKAAIYVRVSTLHHDQKPEVQVEELKRFALARNWIASEVIIDHGYSGATDKRPGLKRLLELVRTRKVDVVLILKMDRLARSLKHLVQLLEEFESLGIKFISLKDQVDMTTASGRLMFHIIGAFAEFERSLIRERTILGLEHAKSKGKKLGRPKSPNYAEIQRLDRLSIPQSQIQKQLKVSKGTIWRALKDSPKSPSKPQTKNPIKLGGSNE